MPGKKKAQKSQSNINTGSSNEVDENSNVRIVDLRGKDSNCELPAEWQLRSFLEHLNSQPCFTFAPDLDCLFNSDDCKTQILTEKQLKFPEHELKKLEVFRSMPHPTQLTFKYPGKTYYTKRLECDNGEVIEVAGNSEEVASEALAALILARFFDEGKLARFLFENYLFKTSLSGKQNICLFQVPEVRPNVIESSLKTPRKINEIFIRLEAIQYPRALTIKEFLRPRLKPEEVCISERPKQLTESLELPSKVVLALGDFGFGKCRIERQNFFCPNASSLHRFTLSKASGNLRRKNAFRAVSNSRFHAKEACCALILSQYYGDKKTARRLLENLIKGATTQVLLFDQPGTLKKSLRNPEKFDPACGRISCVASSLKISNAISQIYKKSDEDFSVRSKSKKSNALEVCKSPLQAVKMRQRHDVSWEKFLFVLYLSKEEQELIYGCIYDADDGAKIEDESFSSSPYVALQLCCLKLLKEDKIRRSISCSLLRKFCCIYRKEFKCYRTVTVIDAPEGSQFLELARSMSTSVVEEIEQENDEFEKAVEERRVIQNSRDDPGNCEFMYEKVQLLTRFLAAPDLFRGESCNKLPSDIVSGAEEPPCIVERCEDSAFDLFKLRQKLGHQNLDLRLHFYEGQFFVRLAVDDCMPIIATSFVSSREAFRKAMYRAVQLRNAGKCQEMQQSLADCDLCCLVNKATQKMGVSFDVFAQSVYQTDDKKFKAKLVRNAKVWESGLYGDRIGALRTLLVAVCCT